MNVVLPTERQPAENYNPKLMVLFGKPKSGKSTIAANIDDNLIIDLEDGYRALPVMKVLAHSARELFEIKAALQNKMTETGKVPYKFITIDNATRLEEMALTYALYLYHQTPMGVDWKVLAAEKGKDAMGKPVTIRKYDMTADVRTLPKGSGYLYLREALKKMIGMFVPYCHTLILICHVKDRQIEKNSEEMTEMTVDLAGKVGDIICGEADAIGYIYRKDNATYITFNSGDNINKGARPLHLRNKVFKVIEQEPDGTLKVDTDQLFIKEK